MFIGTKKIVVGNLQDEVIVSTVDVIESIGFPIGCFINVVQLPGHLFERPKLFGDGIAASKPN